MICEDCRWYKYPECLGTIMIDGSYMNIEKLAIDFQCGQKEREVVTNFTESEPTVEERLTALEAEVFKN